MRSKAPNPNTRPAMPSAPDLSAMQSAFAKAIRYGPEEVPFDAFKGDQRRVMLGFAVHANAISHGRLVALEETFPYTLELIGQENFNQQSRAFVEAGCGSDASLDGLGAEFANWLEQQGEAQGSLFARFEWAWLESYHAAEAEPLTRSELAELDEARLLAMKLERHPAARLAQADEALCGVLTLPEASEHVLIARPDAEVLIHPMTQEAKSCFDLLAKQQSVEQILSELTQSFDDAAILPAILHLMDAGALTRP